MIYLQLYKAKLSALAKEFYKKLNRLQEWQVIQLSLSMIFYLYNVLIHLTKFVDKIKLDDLMDSWSSSQQRQMLLEIRLHLADEDYGHYFVGLFNHEPRDLPSKSILLVFFYIFLCQNWSDALTNKIMA